LPIAATTNKLEAKMKLNLEDLMDKQNETPAEEPKEEEKTEIAIVNEEQFNVGDVVYLTNYPEPALIVHSLNVPDEDPTWIEVVWFSADNEMYYSAISMMCLTHTKPEYTHHNTPM
jgi:hypothetical protein